MTQHWYLWARNNPLFPQKLSYVPVIMVLQVLQFGMNYNYLLKSEFTHTFSLSTSSLSNKHNHPPTSCLLYTLTCFFSNPFTRSVHYSRQLMYVWVLMLWMHSIVDAALLAPLSICCMFNIFFSIVINSYIITIKTTMCFTLCYFIVSFISLLNRCFFVKNVNSCYLPKTCLKMCFLKK